MEKFTVLIVDDVKLNIDALTDILSENYNIMAAISGESAIKIMRRKVPDLVLLDVSMPEIDGFDVLKYMKENPCLASVPVIFVTGENSEAVEERGIKMGAVDYIKKPFSERVIRAKVRNHLELKAYRTDLEMLIRERTNLLEERTKLLEERTKQLEKTARRLVSSRNAIIVCMSLMSEIHDNVTGSHINRIKAFVSVLVNKMIELRPDVISQDLARQIVLYSPLHDVGKVGVSDAILKKTGLLTREEFEIMKLHTLYGADLLRRTEQYYSNEQVEASLKVAIEIAESHHEKFDGSGYPYGLKGEKIPMPARIVAIADIYDALRSERPYKRGFTHAEAVNIIVNGDGRTVREHFDPLVLKAFELVSNEFEKICP